MPIHPSPLHDAPQHIRDLLARLHKLSLDQEAKFSPATGKIIPGDLEDKTSPSGPTDFDTLMRDKFIALDEDKCLFMYQLISAMGATHVVEAGTSFGVSTIYLALAVGANMGRLGKGKGSGEVIATEKEESKVETARKYWRECGEMVESVIELRVGDLRETLKSVDDGVDLLLLDIWSPLALPTLQLIQPRLRPGAVVLTDNTISSAEGYKDLLAYLRAEGSGFANMTMPFTNGFEMSVYTPLMGE